MNKVEIIIYPEPIKQKCLHRKKYNNAQLAYWNMTAVIWLGY